MCPKERLFKAQGMEYSESLKLWTEKENPSTSKRESGGTKLRGILPWMDIIGAVIGEISRQFAPEESGDPMVLEDERGSFVFGEREGRWGSFAKEYISGAMKGKAENLSEEQFHELEKESEALYGYKDKSGEFVPGILNRDKFNRTST